MTQTSSHLMSTAGIQETGRQMKVEHVGCPSVGPVADPAGSAIKG